MASRNGRGGGATPGGRAARQPTPTSPSPSPEPSSESTRIDANNLLGGHNALNANNNPASSSSSGGLLPSALGPGNNSGRSTHSGVPGQTPFHHVLPLEEDPNEPYRQRAEDCTRNVIDSLYQLAVCAADVQVGREDIIGMKVNEVITHLSSLSSSASNRNPDGSDTLPLIPEELLEQIDEGRNPDAWSKNRMARLVSDSQQLAGQRWAIERYREQLAGRVGKLFPELEEEVGVKAQREHEAQRTRPDGQVEGLKMEEQDSGAVGGDRGQAAVGASHDVEMGPPSGPSSS